MHELEGEMQELHEGEFEMHEASHEAAHEIVNHELTQHEAPMFSANRARHPLKESAVPQA
jgi:hypothetical protein